MATKVRLFSNIDTDSDAEAAEETPQPHRHSLPALSFKSEHSVAQSNRDGGNRSSSGSIDFHTETLHERAAEDKSRASSRPSDVEHEQKDKAATSLTAHRDDASSAPWQGAAAPHTKPTDAMEKSKHAATAAQIVTALDANTRTRHAHTHSSPLPAAAGARDAAVGPTNTADSSRDGLTFGQAAQVKAAAVPSRALVVRQSQADTADANDPMASGATTDGPGRTRARSEESDTGSDGFADAILPRHRNTHAAVPVAAAPTVPRGPHDRSTAAAYRQDTLDEILVRAQLRAQERRRMVSGATPSPSLVATPQQSTRQLSYSVAKPSAPREVSATVHVSVLEEASQSLSRRLTSENGRLRQEVERLTRDNARLRGAAHSADMAEVARLQLTVDLMRTEMQQGEVAHQHTLTRLAAEKGEMERQLSEVVEQVEGYAGAATQYKALYEDKLRELEGIKRQVQGLLQDVHAMEHRQRTAEGHFQERLMAEQAKTERAERLLEDVKAQREQVRALNEQLQREVHRAAEERADAQGALKSVETQLQQALATGERASDALRSELETLRTTLADKERSHAVYVREAERVQEGLQQRLQDAMRDGDTEVARQRQLVERVRAESKVALEEQTRQCAALKAQLRAAEQTAQKAVVEAEERRHTQDVQRVEQYRERLAQARDACEAAERAQAQLTRENARLLETAEHYKGVCASLSADLSRSEQLREEAMQGQTRLSTALEQLTAHDEGQTRRVAQLEAMLAQAQDEVTHYRALVGPSTEEAMGDMRQLIDENERLSGECTRLAAERDVLIDENGRIAQELLKWRQEMSRLVSARPTATTAPAPLVSAAPETTAARATR